MLLTAQTNKAKNMNKISIRINRYLMAALVAFVALMASTSARADDVSDAITATETLVTGYVTSIGGALIAVAVLWIGFRVGAKYVRKLGGL